MSCQPHEATLGPRETDRQTQTDDRDRQTRRPTETQTDTDTGSDRDTEAQTEDTNQWLEAITAAVGQLASDCIGRDHRHDLGKVKLVVCLS